MADIDDPASRSVILAVVDRATGLNKVPRIKENHDA
jgi:hypothetical protein